MKKPSSKIFKLASFLKATPGERSQLGASLCERGKGHRHWHFMSRTQPKDSVRDARLRFLVRSSSKLGLTKQQQGLTDVVVMPSSSLL